MSLIHPLSLAAARWANGHPPVQIFLLCFFAVFRRKEPVATGAMELSMPAVVDDTHDTGLSTNLTVGTLDPGTTTVPSGVDVAPGPAVAGNTDRGREPFHSKLAAAGDAAKVFLTVLKDTTDMCLPLKVAAAAALWILDAARVRIMKRVAEAVF